MGRARGVGLGRVGAGATIRRMQARAALLLLASGLSLSCATPRPANEVDKVDKINGQAGSAPRKETPKSDVKSLAEVVEEQAGALILHAVGLVGRPFPRHVGRQ